jgi:imidazolonepropionase-like amidohydrolase
VPGFELHDEMELMTQAGLTPAQVLRAAAMYPARVLRHDADLGGIHAQKYADLVLLDENPLADIANTRRIAGVFVNGRYLAKNELAAMLAQTRKHAETQ